MNATLKTALDLVKKMYDAMVNRRERMGAIAFVAGFKQDVRDAFDQGIDPTTGQAWPSRKDNKPHKLMWKTGRMRGVAIDAADSAVPMGWGVTITLPGPEYAFAHIKGGARLPKRNFWGVSPATQAAASKQCKEEIVRLALGGN